MNMSNALRRLERHQLLLPPLLSAILAVVSYATPGVTYDGHTYLQIARNIHYGIGLGWQALWASPLYSVLIALVSWLSGSADLQEIAGIVSALMGVALTAAVCFLAREIFDRRVAMAAGFITAVFPHFRWISRSPEPEAAYTALLLISLALLLVALRRDSLPLSSAAGVCFALTYLCRSEGLVVMVFVLATITIVSCLRARQTAVFKLIATVVVCFMLASLPYLVFLKQGYGAWTISPKKTYLLTWMKWRTYHDNDKGEADNEDLWGLSSDGKLKWQQPSGLGDLTTYLLSHPAKSLKVYMYDLSLELPGRIPNNSGMQNYPQVYPLILSLLAVFAAFRRWGDDSARKKAVLYGPLLILLILPVFTAGWWKYLVPYAPLVIIAGCAGMAQIISRLGQSDKRSRWILAAATLSLVLWFWSSGLPPRRLPAALNGDRDRQNYSSDAEQAGRWIAATLGPGHNYMVKWSKLVYFLNGLWTAAPVADFPELLKYGRAQGAEFYVREIPPEIPLAEIMNPPPGLVFQTLYRSPASSYTVAVYRFVYITNKGA